MWPRLPSKSVNVPATMQTQIAFSPYTPSNLIAMASLYKSIEYFLCHLNFGIFNSKITLSNGDLLHGSVRLSFGLECLHQCFKWGFRAKLNILHVCVRVRAPAHLYCQTMYACAFATIAAELAFFYHWFCHLHSYFSKRNGQTVFPPENYFKT